MAPYRSPSDDEWHADRQRIALVASSGTVRSLVELLPFLPPASHVLGPDAADAAERVLARARPLNLAWFEASHRAGRMRAIAPAWDALDARALRDARTFPAIVALASFHRSGFVREEAVSLLAERGDGSEIPLLLLRANDWVDRVQALAMRALLARFEPEDAAAWARSLGLVEHLGVQATRRRRDFERLGGRAETLLETPKGRAVLADALTNGSLDVRRAAIEIARRRAPPADLHAMLLRADADPWLAMRAATLLLGSAHLEEDDLVRLAHDRRGAVRAAALEAWCTRREAPLDRLRAALFDEARRVRELARHFLARSPGASVDFAAQYRSAVRDLRGREQLGALRGLAEVGTPGDVPCFLSFAESPNAQHRAAAIDGLGRVGGATEHDVLLRALDDVSPDVRRAARPHVRRLLGRRALQARGARG